jgi:hypothetical protein
MPSDGNRSRGRTHELTDEAGVGEWKETRMAQGERQPCEAGCRLFVVR